MMVDANREWTVQPHGQLEEIDDGILTVAGTIKMPLGSFPRRMTVLRLAGGGTAIWSAVPLDEPQMARIEALGPPRFLIVPNQAHRLDAPAWKARYPDAKVIAPPSAREKVAEVVQVDAVDDIIGDPDIAFMLIAGAKLDEFALLVTRDDRATLIVNDAIAHVRHPHGTGANIMARLFGFGVHGPQVPRVVKRMMIENPKALARQFRDWATLPGLVRIIVSHGEPIADQPARALTTLADKLAR